jgi:hypothetical protein
MRPAIPGAFAVGIGLSFIGFVNIRGTQHACGRHPPGLPLSSLARWHIQIGE